VGGRADAGICQVREGEPNEEKGQEGRQKGPEKREVRPATRLGTTGRSDPIGRLVFVGGQKDTGDWLTFGRGLWPFQRAFAQIEKSAARRRRPRSAAPEWAARPP